MYSCATFAIRTIRHDSPIEEAAAVLLDESISALPVVGLDGGIYVRYFATSSIARSFICT
ncbi:MAG: hypothetical protein EXR68_04240 [Dehalococcoidia bacterium]|nr:hypothetical protein [Dehalococcoidia bacterium]